jgi:hypothetical protein
MQNTWFRAEHRSSSWKVKTVISRNNLAILCLGFLVLVFCPTTNQAEETRASVLTVEQIWKEATARQSGIKSIRVEYNEEWKKLLDIPSMKSINISVKPSHIVFVYEGERRYLEKRGPARSSNGSPIIPSKSVFDGANTYSYRVGSVSVEEGKVKSKCEDGESYCNFILQMPYTDQEVANLSNSWTYPHCMRIIDGNTSYSVLPQQELVDGAWCHVLEYPKRDKIWIDPQLGCTIRRRERYDDVNGVRVVLDKIQLAQFVEAAPGIWVPKECLVQFFPSRANPPEHLNKQYLEQRIIVESVTINQVTDNDFSLSVPAGTQIVDRNGSYKVKGDRTLLLGGLADLAEGYVAKKKIEPRWPLIITVAAISAIVVIVLGRYAWRKYCGFRA